MLGALAYGIGVAGLALLVGWAVWRWLGVATVLEASGRWLALPALLLTGLAVLGTWASWLSLVTGVGGLIYRVGVGVLVVVCVVSLRGEMAKKLSAWRTVGNRPAALQWLWVGFGLYTVLFYLRLAVPAPGHYDHYLYYHQAMAWDVAHGAVVGLGNLHYRLAFNSGWHTLTAALVPTGGNLGRFADTTALLAAVSVLAYSYQLLVRPESRPLRALSGVLLVATVWLERRYGNSTNASADTALYLGLFAVLGFALAARHAEHRTWGMVAVVGLLSAFLFTVKLPAAGLAAVCLGVWLGLLRQHRYRAAVVGVGLVALVLLPWVGRSYKLSGTLVYPIAQTAVGSPDWQIPTDRISAAAEDIRYWAVEPTNRYREVASLGFFERMERVFRRLQVVDVLVVALACVLVFGYWVLRFRAWLATSGPLPEEQWAGWSVGFLLTLVVWVIGGPDPRFIVGWFWLPLGALGYVWAQQSVTPQRTRNWHYVLVLGLVVFLKAPNFNLPLLLPEPLAERPYAPQVIGGSLVHVPIGTDQCGPTPLPCSPYPEKGFAPRGPALRDGYRAAPAR